MSNEPPKIDTRPKKPNQQRISSHLRMCSTWCVFGLLAAVIAPLAYLGGSEQAGKTSAFVAFCLFVLAYLSLICSKLDDLQQ
jgi:hypothetical protein